MEPLRIHLFGGFLLERGGVALPPIASRVGRSVFAYLVAHPGRPLQRDHLAGTFWPDLPDGRARRRLSHTLWQIQDVVNSGQVSHLEVTPDTMAFDTSAPHWVDVEEFERNFVMSNTGRPDDSMPGGIKAAALRTCVELYRGDFLAGYFDDWVLVEQDHYRHRYLTALDRLIDASKSAGSYEEALTYARRLTHHDPLREEAHREVMRLCFLLGRTSEALEQFERCCSVLEEELNTVPSPPTIELHEKILRQRRAGIRPIKDGERPSILNRRSESPFVGREDERVGLVDSMERVLAGPGGVVLVEGEPGVGKTRLVLELADDAEWRGFEVSWGSCTPGVLRPFAPLIEVIQSLSPLRLEQLAEQVAPVWLNQALRLAPSASETASSSAGAPHLRPAEEMTRMREALVHTLGGLGRIAPHMVIIDDVHWADQDTLGVLTQIGARLATSRILLVLIYRSEEARGDPEVWDVMRSLDRAAGLGRLVLSPLSVFELEEMVRRMLGLTRLHPAIAAQLHRETGGNALFTLETLLAMRDRGLFDTGADPVTVLEAQMGRTIPVAPRVRSVIEARLSMLGDDVASVYELAAVCGDRIDLPLLEAVTELPRRTVLDSIDELLHRGLIRDDGTGHYRITHDQVRQVVYESIDVSRRTELHRELARLLTEMAPENVETIGHHFREGRDQDHAASFLFEAGRRAADLNAYGTARQHFESAIRCAEEAGWSPLDRYLILGQLESVLNVLGRRGSQTAVLEQMAALVPTLPEMKGDLERHRAWLLAHTGELHLAETSALHSVEVEQSRENKAAVAASLVALGTIRRWSGRPLQAVPDLEQAVVVAGDDPSQRAGALTELASTLIEVQRPEEAMRHLDEALSIYRETEDLRGQAEVAGIEARGLNRQGESNRAAGRYQSAIELCQQIGYRHGEGVNLVNLSTLWQLHGEVARALSGYDEAARIFQELGNRRGEATVLANSASARHNLLGDDERAGRDAARAKRVFADMGDRAREAQCMEVLAGITARAGETEKAATMLEESLELLADTGNRYLEGQHLRSLADLHVLRGDHRSGLVVLDTADQVCEDAGLDDLVVELTSIRAMASLLAGHNRKALSLIRKAVEGLRPGVEHGYLVHHRHAVVAGTMGETIEARKASLLAHEKLLSSLAGLDERDRDEALERVPEHRHIVAAAKSHTPSTISVDLPAVEAPTGRMLGADDLRTVVWTIEHPDDIEITSPVERRQRQLLRLITEAEQRGAVPSVEHLAAALAVSPSTVRRDLSALREIGHQISTRGHRRRVS